MKVSLFRRFLERTGLPADTDLEQVVAAVQASPTPVTRPYTCWRPRRLGRHLFDQACLARGADRRALPGSEPPPGTPCLLRRARHGAGTVREGAGRHRAGQRTNRRPLRDHSHTVFPRLTLRTVIRGTFVTARYMQISQSWVRSAWSYCTSQTAHIELYARGRALVGVVHLPTSVDAMMVRGGGCEAVRVA